MYNTLGEALQAMLIGRHSQDNMVVVLLTAASQRPLYLITLVVWCEGIRAGLHKISLQTQHNGFINEMPHKSIGSQYHWPERTVK